MTQENVDSVGAFDVVVLGYGPTGATMAGLIASKGWRVAVVEKTAAIYDKPRAITADQEALRVFQEIGVADAVLERSTPHPGTDFVGIKGQVIKRFYPAPPPDPLGWPSSFMFMQPQLEATLRTGLESKPGVEILLEHQYVGLAQDGDGVDVALQRLEDGRRVTLRARYVVACDGASSLVRTEFMPDIEDLAFDESWIVVDAWIKGPVDLPPRCMQFCRPSRPGTYIVGPGTLRRWEIKLLPHERPEMFQQDSDAVWRVLGEFVDTRSLEHCRTAVYRFHALVADQWRDRRVFLAGDAAHQMPPFMGQGMCAGIRDAFNLAWKLDEVMRGRVTEGLLDTYSDERKRHVRTVVGHAKSFGLIIGELDLDSARERDRILEGDLAAGRAETVRQRFIPGLELGLLDLDTEGRPTSGAGELFLQPWVCRPGQPWSRLDDLIGPNFVIAGTSADLATVLGVELLGDWLRQGGKLIRISSQDDLTVETTGDAFDWVFAERDGLLVRWLAERDGFAVIARPDRYVYGVPTNANDLYRMVRSLCASLGRE